MKTIKVIDLLNKIANGEEVPEEITYRLNKWYYSPTSRDYYKKNDNGMLSFQMTYVSNPEWLNIEVEIIEEEKEIEKINHVFGENGYLDLDAGVELMDKINELIDSDD